MIDTAFFVVFLPVVVLALALLVALPLAAAVVGIGESFETAQESARTALQPPPPRAELTPPFRSRAA